jgi:hypothetical protein
MLWVNNQFENQKNKKNTLSQRTKRWWWAERMKVVRCGRVRHARSSPPPQRTACARTGRRGRLRDVC